MKLIDIINNVFGTNLINVTASEISKPPEYSNYLLTYNNQAFDDKYVLIKALDEAQAARILLSSREGIRHFSHECKIDEIIQDSENEDLIYLQYWDKKHQHKHIIVNAKKENALKVALERYPDSKSMGYPHNIDEVIA
jgi:hypothetical protein